MYYKRKYFAPRTPSPQCAPTAIAIKPECVIWLNGYSGQDVFISSLKDQFQKKGTLTEKQWRMAEKNYQNSLPRVQLPTLNLNAPVPIMINRTAAFREIRDKYKLQYGVFALKIKSITDAGTARNGNKWAEMEVVADADTAVNACRVCGKTLTDHASVLTGVGSVCAKKYFPTAYATYKKNPQQFIAPFKAEVAKLGTFKIKVWQNQVTQNPIGFVTAVDSFLNQKAAPTTPAPSVVEKVRPTRRYLGWDPKSEPWKGVKNERSGNVYYEWKAEEFRTVASWVRAHGMDLIIDLTNDVTGNTVTFEAPIVSSCAKIISLVGSLPNGNQICLHIMSK